jgi:hypothetical protein
MSLTQEGEQPTTKNKIFVIERRFTNRTYYYLFLIIITNADLNCIGGVMVSLLATSMNNSSLLLLNA